MAQLAAHARKMCKPVAYISIINPLWTDIHSLLRLTLASFSALSHHQFLIACSMQKHKVEVGKAWKQG